MIKQILFKYKFLGLSRHFKNGIWVAYYGKDKTFILVVYLEAWITVETHISKFIR